jgi:hypothetical protein
MKSHTGARIRSYEQKKSMPKYISNFAIVENTSNTIELSKEESNSKSTENSEFDTAITEDELVLSASQTDSLINGIFNNSEIRNIFRHGFFLFIGRVPTIALNNFLATVA